MVTCSLRLIWGKVLWSRVDEDDGATEVPEMDQGFEAVAERGFGDDCEVVARQEAGGSTLIGFLIIRLGGTDFCGEREIKV
jgi:hypothetical protein